MAEDHEVGYGKPPKSGQFKKGQSGNPKGRPKGARNMQSIVRGEALENIAIMLGGKKIRVTRVKALVMRLFHEALGGNARAIAQLIPLLLAFLPEPESETSDQLSEDERAILSNHVELQRLIEETNRS